MLKSITSKIISLVVMLFFLSGCYEQSKLHKSEQATIKELTRERDKLLLIKKEQVDSFLFISLTKMQNELKAKDETIKPLNDQIDSLMTEINTLYFQADILQKQNTILIEANEAMRERINALEKQLKAQPKKK